MSVADNEVYVLKSDVLDVVNNFTTAWSCEFPPPAEVVDALWAALEKLQPRPVPDDGRRIVLEVHDETASDLRFIERTRGLSSVQAVKWAILTAGLELTAREKVARRMAVQLRIDMIEARSYVDRDRMARLIAEPRDVER
jgi:hypothetical protein